MKQGRRDFTLKVFEKCLGKEPSRGAMKEFAAACGFDYKNLAAIKSYSDRAFTNEQIVKIMKAEHFGKAYFKEEEIEGYEVIVIIRKKG